MTPPRSVLSYFPTYLLEQIYTALVRMDWGLGLRVSIAHTLWWRRELDALAAEARTEWWQ